MQTALRVWMEQQGLTNGQVAKKTGYSREQVWRLATGERPITEGFKWRFAETFGIDTALAVFGDKFEQPAA